MNDSKEKFSAYLDGDLSVDELKSLSVEDAQVGEDKFCLTSRYQLMGDAMRGEVGDASLIDVSMRVREALRDESLSSVESPVRQAASKTKQPIFDFGAWFAPFAKPLGGLAVAASVALVTVIAMTQMDSNPEPAGLLAETDHQKVNIPAAAVVAIRPDVKPVVANVAVNNKASQSRSAAYLDTYLAEHAEFAAQDTMQGRMPYARAVSYESK